MTLGPAFPDGLKGAAVVIDVSQQDIEGLWARCEGWLSPEDHNRINRQQHRPTREAMIVGRLLLRRLLAVALGRDEALFEITTDGHGKPYLGTREIAFNMSHSGAYVAVAIACVPVGIDIEVPQSLDNAAGDDPFCNLDRALTTAERDMILECPVAHRRSRLLDVWTRKEALMKCDGRGFGLDPTDICTVMGTMPDTVEGAEIGRWSAPGDISLSLALQGSQSKAQLCWAQAILARDAFQDPEWFAANFKPIDLRPWPGDHSLRVPNA